MSENVAGEGNDIVIKAEIPGMTAMDKNLKKMTGVITDFNRDINRIMQPLTDLQKGGKGSNSALEAIGHVQSDLLRIISMRLAQIQINTASKFQQDLMVKAAKREQGLLDAIKRATGGGEKGDGLGSKIWDAFKNLGGMMKRIFQGMQKVWNKTAGALFKKTGSMGINKLLGLGGAAVLGALVGKMISSSPMLQAMFKIMNTSLTLILRPIGDFFGSFIRPMSIYFLKEIAIPFFMQNKKMMNIGEQWGKTALGFFINPGKAIQSAIVMGLKDIPYLAALTGITKEMTQEAKFFQEDPGGFKRWAEGVKDMEGQYMVSPWGQISPGYYDKEINPEGPGEYEDYGMTDEEIFARDYPTVTTSDFESGSLTKMIYDWFVKTYTAGAEEESTTRDENTKTIEDNTDVLEEWGASWNNFTTSIDAGAKDWGRQISRWADEQATAWGGFTKQIEKDTQSWLEWAGGGIEQAWEWISNFGKVNEAFADTAKDNEEAQTSLTDNFWSWVESIRVAIFGTRVATDAFAATIVTAGDKITTAADIATGGIFQGSGHGRPLAEGTGEKSWDPLTGLLNFVTGQDNPPGTVLGGAFGEPTKGPMYSTPKADDVGYSSKLGEYSDTRFESSPGKFVDIYSKGEKVDPNSPEGKTIQGIYQTQYDTKIANEKQQATMAAVKKEVTTADAGKAYILAGGGEAGLAAVEFAKAEGLDFAKYADIVALADKFGLTDHPMIKTAKEGLAKKIAMAEKIMQSRIDAGQTPSIQGDMLELFPDVEDSAFGWSDERLADFDAANQARYDSFAAAVTGGGTTITSAGEYNPNTGYVGDVGGLPSWLGGTVSSINPAAGPQGTPGTYGGGPTGGNPGGRGPGGNRGPGGGPKGGGGSGTKGPGGGKGGTGGRKGNSGGGTSSSSGGGTTSGKKGTGKKGKSGQGRRQFGGIIDEPIIGTGLWSGDEWRLGESQKEMVTPLGEYGSDGNFYSINIHVGNITKEADYMKLKPLIQRWILEASSRRGMV